MTARALRAPPAAPINWAMIGVVLAITVQLAGVVAFGARTEARVSQLQETTKPLRDGDLVAIGRDVAWIRAQLEREDRQ